MYAPKNQKGAEKKADSPTPWAVAHVHMEINASQNMENAKGKIIEGVKPFLESESSTCPFFLWLMTNLDPSSGAG